MEFRSRLREWLSHTRLAQSEVADKAGISRSLMCQLVGLGEYKSNPSQRTVDAVVGKGFGLTLVQFYAGPTPPPSPTSKRRKRAA